MFLENDAKYCYVDVYIHLLFERLLKNDKKTNGKNPPSDNQMKLKFKIIMEANFLFTETQFV